MFLLTIIILGIFEIYLLSIIFRAKNVAKVQQIFQLCKFFAKKIYQQFLKVIQNKIVNRSFTAFYNFYNVEKFSKIKNHLFTSVFHCVSLSSTSKNLKSPVNSYKNAHLFAYIKYFYYCISPEYCIERQIANTDRHPVCRCHRLAKLETEISAATR